MDVGGTDSTCMSTCSFDDVPPELAWCAVRRNGAGSPLALACGAIIVGVGNASKIHMSLPEAWRVPSDRKRAVTILYPSLLPSVAAKESARSIMRTVRFKNKKKVLQVAEEENAQGWAGSAEDFDVLGFDGTSFGELTDGFCEGENAVCGVNDGFGNGNAGENSQDGEGSDGGDGSSWEFGDAGGSRDVGLRAVHVSAAGAATLMSKGVLPGDLQELVDAGEAVFVPGLRISSLACGGVPPLLTPRVNKKRPTSTAFDDLQSQSSTFVSSSTCGSDGLHDGQKAASHARTEPAEPKFRFVELFSGIGGFRIGCEAAGGKCVFASELDFHARQAYLENFHDKENLFGDITAIEERLVPEFDLLTAGFPCQSFSSAGFQRGLADAVGALFLEVTRFLYSHRPRGFLLENVPNLSELDGGLAFEIILAELRGAGYHVLHRVLNARPLVPQRRQRLYFVGFRDADAAERFEWPSWASLGDVDAVERAAAPGMARPTESTNPWPKVGGILETLSPAQWASLALTEDQWNRVWKKLSFQLNPWGRLVKRNSASRTIMSSYHSSRTRNSQFVLPATMEAEFADWRRPPECDLATTDPVLILKRAAFEPRQPSSLSQNDLPRYFSPRECCRLQGFPEWFRPNGGIRFYHMIGNAVVPLVINDLVQQMLSSGLMS